MMNTLLALRSKVWKFAALIIACFIAGAGALTWKTYHDTVQSELQRLYSLDVLLSEQTERTFIDAQKRLEDATEYLMSKTPQDTASFQTLAGSTETHAALSAIIGRVDNLLAIAVVGLDGKGIGYSQTNFADRHANFSNAPTFRRLNFADDVPPFIGEPTLGEWSGRMVTRIGRRITAPNGQVLGMVLMSIKLDHFENLYRAAQVPEGVSIRMWREDGVLLASYPRIATPGLVDTNNTLGGLLDDHPIAAQLQGHLTEGTLLAARKRVPGTRIVVSVVRTMGDTLQLWRQQTFWRLLAVSVLSGAIAVITILAMRLLRDAVESSKTLAETEKMVADLRLAKEINDIVGMANIGVWRTRLHPDLSLEREAVSHNLADVLGTHADQVDLERLSEYILPQDYGIHRTFLAELYKLGTASVEYRLRLPGNHLVWLHDVSKVIDRAADGTVQCVTTTSNITAEVEKRALHESASRLIVLGEMASGIAHELNQPLAIMSAIAENLLLAAGPDASQVRPDRLEQKLNRIVGQAHRASAIIENLRDFSSGKPNRDGTVSLPNAASLALQLIGSRIRADHVTVHCDLSPDLPPVLGSETIIEQVLVNLLNNAHAALRARPADERHIAIEAAVSGGQVIMTVSDTGGGIPPDVIERIFEPFFTTKSPGEGTGLGLSIVANAMRSIGGTIRAENGLGGAIFTLNFEIAHPAEQPVPA